MYIWSTYTIDHMEVLAWVLWYNTFVYLKVHTNANLFCVQMFVVSKYTSAND
jgi:hypothetical protein